MKKLFCALFAVFLAASTVFPAENTLTAGKPVKLFICSGQSNMAGGGDIRGYNGAMPEATLPRTDIWIWSSSIGVDTDGWVALGTQSGKGGIGPETPFAVKMAEAFPDHTIAILKISKGATPIEYFLPGEPNPYNDKMGYKTLARLIPEAIADLQAKVDTGVIPSFDVSGFVWMQGEGNANGVMRKEGQYLGQLHELLAFINQTAGTEKIPTVLGRISIQLSPAVVRESGQLRISKGKSPDGKGLPNDLDYLDDGQKRGPIWFEKQLFHVRNDQEKFTAEYSPAAWVDIDDLTLKDSYHYNPDGYTVMGGRFAEAMLKLLNK